MHRMVDALDSATRLTVLAAWPANLQTGRPPGRLAAAAAWGRIVNRDAKRKTQAEKRRVSSAVALRLFTT
jgi:hypothetical protein